MANYDAEVIASSPVLIAKDMGVNGYPCTGAVVDFSSEPVAYPATRIAPDASDKLVYVCDEAPNSAMIKNSGTFGAPVDLVTKQVSGLYPINGSPGLFGGALDITSAAVNGYETGNPTVALPTAYNIPVPITVSGWILVRYFPTTAASPFAKAYRPSGTWSNPFITFHWMVVLTTGGTNSNNWDMRLTIAGGLNIYAASRRLNHNTWHHVGWTWDGATLRIYQDGDQIRQDSVAGALDYGTSGPYMIGADPPAPGGDQGPYLIQDVRVANVVRPASYFRQVYQKGVLQFGYGA